MLRVLGRAKGGVRTPYLSAGMAHSQWFHVEDVEEDLLHRRLKPVETSYDFGRCCMTGTRKSILNRTVAWVTEPQEGNDASRKNTYWIYGSPGIGKTSLAHSICERLHDQQHLAGAFFCRRDDANLSEHRN